MGDNGSANKNLRGSTTKDKDVRGGVTSLRRGVSMIRATNFMGYSSRRKNGEDDEVKLGRFRGFYVCKEFDGERILGTVISVSYKRNQLKVEYDDNRTEFLDKDEVLRLAATQADIEEAQRLQKSKNSKKNKGKRPASEGACSSNKKRGNNSGPKK